MRCQYCQKTLGIVKVLKGQTFCSLEHQELHLNAEASASLERLRAAIVETPQKKLKLERPAAKTELAQRKSEEAPQSWRTSPQKVGETLAVVDASPALEFASPAIAVAKVTDSEFPEAPFFPELPAPQDQPGFVLKTCAEEPISGSLRWPVSPGKTPSIPTSPALVLDVSPAVSPAEVAPVGSQPTWISVPQGYPPVVVSALATMVLDSNGAALVPLPMGEPCRGKGPVPLPKAVAMETPLPAPRLPSRVRERRPAAEIVAAFDRPPVAPACNSAWKARLGSGSALPALAAVLDPKLDVLRTVPPSKHRNLGELPSFSSFAEAPAIRSAPSKLLAAKIENLPASVIPLWTLPIGQAPSTTEWALEKAAEPLAIDSPASSSWEPSSVELTSSWLQLAVASQLPQAAHVLQSAPGRLNLEADLLPLESSVAAGLAPVLEPEAPVVSALPFLGVSSASSIAAPGMPLWSSTRLLWSEEWRRAPLSEQQPPLSPAYLHASVPSPWSLVTWSQALSISIPACSPTNLSKPAPVVLRANPGYVHALRPSSASRRGHRLTPLLSRLNGASWKPDAPAEASVWPPVIEAIAPGSAGTAPPDLSAVRVQPASMPVLPQALLQFGIEARTGLAVQGLWSGDTLQLASVDIVHAPWGPAWELHVASGTVLPGSSVGRHTPEIALAPCEHGIGWKSFPPLQSVGALQAYSALPRLAWSVTAGVAGGHE